MGFVCLCMIGLSAHIVVKIQQKRKKQLIAAKSVSVEIVATKSQSKNQLENAITTSGEYSGHDHDIDDIRITQFEGENADDQEDQDERGTDEDGNNGEDGEDDDSEQLYVEKTASESGNDIVTPSNNYEGDTNLVSSAVAKDTFSFSQSRGYTDHTDHSGQTKRSTTGESSRKGKRKTTKKATTAGNKHKSIASASSIDGTAWE